MFNKTSRNKERNALTFTIALFVYAGSYMFRQQSAIFRELLDPSELLEIQINMEVYLKYVADGNQCVNCLTKLFNPYSGETQISCLATYVTSSRCIQRSEYKSQLL
jgi:hypothetical protein